MNDVGEALAEEINSVARLQTALNAQNFGWGALPDPNNPEGPSSFGVNPAYYYGHLPSGCSASITGGAFFDPSGPGFGGGLQNDYFYADYCHNEIRSWEMTSGTNGTSVLLASALSARPVDLAASDFGGLYYLTRTFGGSGNLFLISGSAVPEPATVLTTALALGLLMLRQPRFQFRPAGIKSLYRSLRGV